MAIQALTCSHSTSASRRVRAKPSGISASSTTS